MPLPFVRPPDSDAIRLSRLSFGDKLQLMARIAPVEIEAVEIMCDEVILRMWRRERERVTYKEA